MTDTLFEKSVLKKIKSSEVSPNTLKKLKKAVIDIDSKSIETLCKSGKAVKLQIEGQDHLYAYRVSNTSRIVFSAMHGKKLVHDIVDTDTMKRSTKRVYNAR